MSQTSRSNSTNVDTVRYKPKTVEVSETEPFKDDLLARKDSAEILTEFVGSLSEPFVLAVDSPWGTGKTTFLRMWRQHLSNEGFPCLYFNAWENDFSDSPMVSLIGEIGAGIESLRLGGEQEKTAQKVFEKTKKAGAALLKAALPTALKLATSGLLDLSAATEADLAKLAEDVAKKQIEKYQADKKTITSFREELAKLVKALAEKDRSATAKPLVFVVDELDRCRPTYAVELLEKIKHLFSVHGLVFVLAIDRQQLGESVKALYGAGMDADGYLRRFIDLEYRLPEADPEKFSEAQFTRFGLDTLLNSKIGETRQDAANLREEFPKLFAVFRFSLRTQEQCFTQLAVILRTTPPNAFLYSALLAVLICLRVAKRELYLNYCSGHATPKDVVDHIRSIPGGAQLMDSHLGAMIEAHLVRGIRNHELRKTATDDYYKRAKEAETKPTPDSLRAKEVSYHFQWVGRNAQDMTAYLFKKIEMAHRFVQPEAK